MNLRKIRPLLLTALLLSACGQETQPPEPETSITDGVFVHLFEWRWPDIARECEDFLGPAGFAAVQISPPQEHIEGPAWWTRYQPVSYRIESRSGSREEFADMVQRCRDAGVAIYADAVINHMAGFPEGRGVAGSAYREYEYPVPYDSDDFHHCGANDEDRITDYQNAFEVQNCQLGTLDDLDTGSPAVQAKIAAYLNDLLSLGVTGFRIDAVKHIAADEARAILDLVDGDPFVFQEVIDHGNEPIKAKSYTKNGMVTEFRFASKIIDVFERGNLEALAGLGSDPEWLKSGEAVVFVDNHDTQRSHLGDHVLNYKDGRRHDLAVAFMLAYPYGYPKVMSSYRFEDDEQGPPELAPIGNDGACDSAWVCEHRRDTIASLVKFRRATAGAEIANWQIMDNAIVSFSRGEKGHVVINTAEEARQVEVQTGLQAGQYKDLISGRLLTVDDDGLLDLALEGESVAAVVAGSFIVTLNVEVPANAPTVYVAGNIDTLGPWDPGAVPLDGDGSQRSITIEVPAGHVLEYKFTLGSWDREALTPDGSVPPNHTLKVRKDMEVEHTIVNFKKDPKEYMTDWQGSGVEGTLVYWSDVASEHLSETRHVEVWLPPGYDEETERRYPVIYMADGQNLFDLRIANTGIDWGVDEAIMRGVSAGVHGPAIVVGVWSSAERAPEYSPWHGAPNYARFLIEELMPRVNAEYRTKTGPDYTFAMGSSMGGLLSYYLVKNHPDVFGACGCISTHFPFSEAITAAFTGADPTGLDDTPYILKDIDNGDTVPKGVRFFFDYGTEGLDAQYAPTHAAVRKWLLEQGLIEGEDFLIQAYEGLGHDEASWRAHLDDQMRWLLSGIED